MLGNYDRSSIRPNLSFRYTQLGDAQKRGGISKKQEAAELQRRNILSPEYSYNQDELQIAIENEGLEPEEPIDPRTGEPIGYANSNDIAVANSAA